MKPTTPFGKFRRVAHTQLPTKWGVFETIGFERELHNGIRQVELAVALVLGDITGAPLLRIHSQCLTGEALASLRCDCGEQLELAMRAIANERSGILIYEYQEGRGIGLMAKLEAYGLQDAGFDTIEANHVLGFVTDNRDFRLPVAILHDLGVRQVRLLSNNPAKSRALDDAGIEVIERIPCEAQLNPYSIGYLRTKKEKMGHALRLPGHAGMMFTEHAPGNGPSRRDEGGGAETQEQFASIETAIRELRAGRLIVIADDEDRENEGDLVMAAQMTTSEHINFMASHGRGLICLAMTGERLDELELPLMTPDGAALLGTGFTVSIDVKCHGVTTGISAHDRAQTIRAAIDARSRPEDFARPGHVFPLRCRAGGVLERRGHTEAAVDLARLAGLYAAGVICEILNEDGTMARRDDLVRFCKRHELKMITVAELQRYRLAFDSIRAKRPNGATCADTAAANFKGRG
jgi:3,4-dihydroxy-2-butanone 4-phosphate synthase/GTP cyclohydrolase II